MSSNWSIQWAKQVKKSYKKFPYKNQFQVAIENIVCDPFKGSNIKRLHGELEGLYRYRIGDYRLIYKIEGNQIILLVYLGPRGDAY